MGVFRDMFLRIVIFLLIALRSPAASWLANSVVENDVSNLYYRSNMVTPGDIMNLPAGTNTWLYPFIITNDLQLIGAGINKTVIIDPAASDTPGNTLISWAGLTTNHFDRLSGFQFLGSNIDGNNVGSAATVEIDGICHALRVDDCEWNLIQGPDLFLDGWIYGCVDHCVFNRDDSFGIQIHEDTWGGIQNGFTNANGDGSWSDQDYLGTTNSVYVEANTFIDTLGPTGQGQSPGAFDMEDGGRIVFRYNNVTNDNIGFHGTETSARERSGREFEIYNNTFFFSSASNTSWFCGFFIRGGTGVIYSNYWNNYDNLANIADYRLTPGPWPPWYNANGFNGWDSNAASFVTGKATITATNQVTDSTQNWSINQFVTNNGAFVLQDSNQNIACWIYSNNPTMAFISQDNHLTGAPFVVSNNDTYTIGFVQWTIDQPGRGQGDLLADHPNGGQYGWPYDTVTQSTNSLAGDALDPIYEWSNTWVANTLNNQNHPYIVPEQPTMITNRDYYDNVIKPGYAPLVYPHPLDNSNPPSANYAPMIPAMLALRKP
jgi:hypothetical protein